MIRLNRLEVGEMLVGREWASCEAARRKDGEMLVLEESGETKMRSEGRNDNVVCWICVLRMTWGLCEM